MGSSDKFCLRWNDFETNISFAFRELRDEKDFFDVTLACGEEQLQAHKLILSACSPFFRSILRRNRHEHPLLYLKGVRYGDLVSILNFMYQGEVNVAQEELNSFLALAEDLKIKGLTQTNSNSKRDILSQPGLSQQSIKRLPAEKKQPPATQSRHLETSTLLRNPITDHANDEIQEIVPIKSEPLTQQTTEVLTGLHHTKHTYPMPKAGDLDDGVLVNANPDAEEYDMEYTDYEDYGLERSSYEGRGVSLNRDVNNTDVESLVQSYMKKTTDEFNGSVWQCLQCGKVSKVSTNLKDHIESNHLEGLQFECSQCSKIFKSRPSLRTHMRLHK